MFISQDDANWIQNNIYHSPRQLEDFLLSARYRKYVMSVTKLDEVCHLRKNLFV